MPLGKATIFGGVLALSVLPSFAQAPLVTLNPKGSFADAWRSSFDFRLCGEGDTDLCGVLTRLQGASATPENLAFVGKQVMEAKPSARNQWKGSLGVGRTVADATITIVGPDTIEIQGCQAIICKTLTYNRIFSSEAAD